MKLATLISHLTVSAKNRPGHVYRADLAHGARVAVKRDTAGRLQITFARRGKPLGDVELVTFKAHGAVPANAERLPAEGQDQRPDPDEPDGPSWFTVTFRWPDTTTAEAGPPRLSQTQF